MKHYKRARAGLPLVPIEPAVGSRSGFGVYGVLDDDGESVLCHECGGRFASVGAHLAGGHGGMLASEYKKTHGLARGSALVCAQVRAAMSAHARARIEAASPAWRALEAARDPGAASAARTGEDLRRYGATYAAIQAANVERGPSTRRDLRTCPVCARPYGAPPTGGSRRTCGRAGCVAALRSAAAAGPRHPERDGAIAAAHAGGASTAALAERYGLGITRVQQIVARAARTPTGS